MQFLYGDGDGPNLTGLANIDGKQTFAMAALQYESTSNDLDAVRAASFILRETPNVRSFADLIIMSPTTWFGLSSLKDSQGRYLINIASPVTEIPTLQSLWDIPVVLSTNVDIGDIFVMNAAKSLRVILRKGLETMVNPGYSDTYFQTGTIGYRVEERLTTAALRPAGIVYLQSAIVS